MPSAAPTQSVYVHAGDGPIDTTIWPPSGFQTPPSEIEGSTVPSEPLYYFSGDAKPGQIRGDVTDTWGKWYPIVLSSSGAGGATTTTSPGGGGVGF